PILSPHSLFRPPTPTIRASHSSFRPPYSRIRVPHSLLRSPTPPIRASPSSIRRVDSPPRTRFEGVDLRGKRPSQLPARRRDDLRSPGGRLRCNASPPGALLSKGSTLAATTDDAPRGGFQATRHHAATLARSGPPSPPRRMTSPAVPSKPREPTRCSSLEEVHPRRHDGCRPPRWLPSHATPRRDSRSTCPTLPATADAALPAGFHATRAHPVLFSRRGPPSPPRRMTPPAAASKPRDTTQRLSLDRVHPRRHDG